MLLNPEFIILNPFPHTTNLQQTTLKTYLQKPEKQPKKISQLLNKVENIVAKGEIAHQQQFHLWPQYLQKSSAAIASKCVCRWKSAKYQNIIKRTVVMTKCKDHLDQNSVSNLKFDCALLSLYHVQSSLCFKTTYGKTWSFYKGF